MGIRVKRAYEEPANSDGLRILVDRMWPRGLSKKDANIDHWLKEIAPSNDLRKWYGHDPEKWKEFKRRYFSELDGNMESVDRLISQVAGHKNVTFVYSAKNTDINNAIALKEYIGDKIG